MNEALKMQISAFVDGELPENESELLLRRLSQDALMRKQVAEYLAIGRRIRRDQEVPGMDSLRGRIAAALGQETVEEEVEQKVAGSVLMTPASGIAVAATVAAIALVGLSQLGGPTIDGLPDNAVAIDLAPAYTEPTAEQVLANSPTERLLEYNRRHDNNGILYRMVTLEGETRWVEIEPNPRLVPGDDPSIEAEDDRDDVTSSE
jgi:negative regulator of sigma E activity